MKFLVKLHPAVAVVLEVLVIRELTKELYNDIKKYRRLRNIRKRSEEPAIETCEQD